MGLQWITPDHYDEAKDLAGKVVNVVPGSTIESLSFNMERPQFKDAAVREALYMQYRTVPLLRSRAGRRCFDRSFGPRCADRLHARFNSLGMGARQTGKRTCPQAGATESRALLYGFRTDNDAALSSAARQHLHKTGWSGTATPCLNQRGPPGFLRASLCPGDRLTSKLNASEHRGG